VGQAYALAKKVLTDNYELLVALANRLLEQEQVLRNKYRRMDKMQSVTSVFAAS
jgi:hypothetical protein